MAHIDEDGRRNSSSYNEEEPLLQRNPVSKKPYNWWKQHTPPWLTFTTTSKRYRFVPLLGCTIVLLNEVEYFFKQVPMMRAVEAMYCLEYYKALGGHRELVRLGTQIPEKLCKDDSIEKDVARTAAWIMMFRMLCACFAAIPLGYIADRRSRRLVLLLHKAGTLVFVAWSLFVYLTYPLLPIWAIYFSGLSALIGGNFDLNLSVLFATYTDVVSNAEERSRLFYVTTSMQYIGQLFNPPIAAWLMNLDGKGGTSDVSLIVSIGMSAVSATLIFFAFPETRELGPTPMEASNVSDDSSELNGVSSRRSLFSALAKSVEAKVLDLRSGVAFLGVWSLVFLFVSMLCVSIGIKSTDWYGIIQYPVIKFHWTFPQTNLVMSLQAVVYILNFALLLPFYNKIGATRNLTPTATALSVMLFSAIVLALGATLLGLSATVTTFLVALVVYTLGTGLPITTQAYLANSIAKDKLARIMAVLSIAATAGKLIASGMTPKLFAIGIDSGTESLKGLPMLVAAGLFVVAGFAVSAVSFSLRTGNRKETV